MAIMERSFYCHQSLMSDPGIYAYLFDELPCDIYDIHDLLQDLLLHFGDLDFHTLGSASLVL